MTSCVSVKWDVLRLCELVVCTVGMCEIQDIHQEMVVLDLDVLDYAM